jgi:methyl-accepting chemotaxis protein
MSQWTIGRKICGGFMLILFVMLCMGAVCIWTMARASAGLNLVVFTSLPVAQLAIQIEREFLNARINFIYFVTIQKPGTLDKGWTRFGNAENELVKLQQLVASSDAFANARPGVEQLTQALVAYKIVLQNIIQVVQQHQNQGPGFNALLLEWARLGGLLVDTAGQLSRAADQNTSASTMQTAARLHSAALTVEAIFLAALILGLAAAFFIVRSVSSGLSNISQELLEASRQAASGSSQIAASAQSLSQAASEQATALIQTSAAGEEIKSMANKNVENSRSAAEIMDEASRRVGSANANIAQMVASMRQISQSSGKISKIIKVIDDIAFQTNILALNAAVEAARAGESGLGFAVVADEVRGLAQRCAQAARDTTGLIEESMASSNEGQIVLNKVTVAVQSITESSDHAKMLVDEVKLGSNDQARGIEGVSKSIAQMEAVTQTLAASAEENAAAGQELSAQAASLESLVTRLNAMVSATSPMRSWSP